MHISALTHLKLHCYTDNCSKGNKKRTWTSKSISQTFITGSTHKDRPFLNKGLIVVPLSRGAVQGIGQCPYNGGQ